ncbi:MAG TPA: hypothetical protein VGZ03_10770 [Acidimicrobiales bacterium]|nr:hypothetical protein [Acidimicrobiales bacterium]
MTAVLARGLRAFGRLWWECLGGDTPELCVATLVVVGVAFALAPLHVLPIIVVPAVAVLALVVSAARGRRGAP